MKLNLIRNSLSSVATLLLAFGAGQTVAADYQSTVSSFNPLAYWRLNETTPSPAPNIVANSSTLGSAADGYIVLDVGKGEPGKVGNSIRLVNNGNVVGYCGSKVDVPFNAALNPKAPFCIEFWAKPNGFGTDATGFQPISSFDPNWYGGANRSGWLFYLNNTGRWQFRMGLTSGYAVQLSATSGNATVGVWQHIAATYDGSTASIYINGVLAGSSAVAAGWLPNPQMALRIGGSSLTGTLSDSPAISNSGISGNRGYDGWMDEVAIYPSLLSDATIAAHYDAATTNTAGYGAQILAANPIGYWNLDEPAVTDPDPSTFPIAANIGSEGSAVNGTNVWGVVAAQNGPAYGGFGVDNKASFFNGESGYLALGDTPGLHFSGNITIMAWIKPRVNDFFRNIITHGWDANYAETFLRISRGEGDVFPNLGYGDGNYYEVGVTDGTGYYDAAAFPIPPGDLGKWLFLAGTYDGTNWNLYRNGELVSSLASANGALDVAERWSIGSRSGPSPTPPSGSSGPEAFAAEGLFFGGSIDEPAIFGTALSAANIKSIYNAAQVPPQITRAPEAPAGTIFSGSSITLSVWAEGSPTLGYQWTSNGVPLGVTTTNITINNLPVGTPTFAVIVTNNYGSVTSSLSLVVVGGPPFITQQPQPATRFVGFPFTFSVAAGGSAPLHYQWALGATPVGADSPKYSGTASLANAGNYSCTVTNSFGTTNSASATLTVLTVPDGYASAVIADLPVAYWRLGETSGTVANDYVGGHNGQYVGATLNQPGFTSADPDKAVAFSGPNSYVGNISGTEINFSGHTNFTLELWANGPASQADESTLIAKGTGASGTLATEQFSIDIAGGKYRFFTRGANNVLYEADAAVGPNGTWQHIAGVYDDTGGEMLIYVNGALSGTGLTRPAGLRASASPITIGSKHLGNDPTYDGTFNGSIDEVVIYNTILSDVAIQIHYASIYGSTTPPFFTLQPKSVTNYVSLPATFTSSASGTVPLYYQWKKNNVIIPDATSDSYTISSLSSADAGSYSVMVTNSVSAANSVIVSLTVLPAPTSPPAISALVLHLPFDNNLTDVTGRGNNGTGIHLTATSSNIASPTFVVDGKLGQGLNYSTDAASTNNFYVTLGVRPDLQFSSNVNFTVAFWVRLPLNYTGGDLPYFTDTPGSTFGSGYVFAPTYGSTATVVPGSDTAVDGGWALSFYDPNGNGIAVYGDIGSINDGGWHHLVHVFDRTSGMVTYLDGVVAHYDRQSGTTAAAAGDVDLVPPNAATIGQDPTGAYGETGSADIDDLGVWRKALTALEAASIYMAASSSGLSFVPLDEVKITVENLGAQIQLTWPSGTLESADELTGPFIPQPSANSPLMVTPVGKKFYRVKL